MDEKGIEEIQGLEKELGNTLIAYYTPPQPANLSDDKIARVRESEKNYVFAWSPMETTRQIRHICLS